MAESQRRSDLRREPHAIRPGVRQTQRGEERPTRSTGLRTGERMARDSKAGQALHPPLYMAKGVYARRSEGQGHESAPAGRFENAEVLAIRHKTGCAAAGKSA